MSVHLQRIDRFLWGRTLRSNRERLSLLSGFVGLFVGPIGLAYGVRESWRGILAAISALGAGDWFGALERVGLVVFFLSVTRANWSWFVRGLNGTLLHRDAKSDRGPATP